MPLSMIINNKHVKISNRLKRHTLLDIDKEKKGKEYHNEKKGENVSR